MPWQKPVSSFSGVFISQGQHDKTLALMSAWLQENVLTDDEMMYEAVCAEEEGDDEKAFRLFESLAGRGDGYAMSALARFYEEGRVVGFDIEKSIEWALKGAETGRTRAGQAISCERQGICPGHEVSGCRDHQPCRN